MLEEKFFKTTYQPGDIFYSPGCLYRYQILGACCPLFDRATLPYPSCSLAWKGKQPSWRRDRHGKGIGRQFIPDISAKGKECYSVQNLDYPKSLPKIWVFTYLKDNPDWWN